MSSIRAPLDGFAMAEVPLRASIEKAFSGPACISVKADLHRSAITALGVHCLFVQSGFLPQDTLASKTNPVRDILSLLLSRQTKERTFRPPEYWLALHPAPEFIFRYTYPGKCGTFVCHCSVKLELDQMFVHVTEEGNADNIQFVGLLVRRLLTSLYDSGGLQVGYTVPETAKGCLSQKEGWDGVFGDLDLLTYNVETYLLEPLLRKALDDREFSGRMEDGKITWNLGTGWLRYGALLVLLGFITTTLLQKKAQQ